MSVLSSQVVRVLEDWRVHAGLTHRQFVAFLERDESEWANMRAGRRLPSESFVRAARRKAAEYGGPWAIRLDAAIQEDALARVAVA